MKFTQKETKKFVELYRELECLWNCDNVDYRNYQRRQAAYEALVNEMDIPYFTVTDAKLKINNLRNTYFQEKTKIEKSKASGEDEVYTPNMKWFTIADTFMGYKSQKSPRNSILVGSSYLPVNENIEQEETKKNKKHKYPELMLAAKELAEVRQYLEEREEDEFDAFGRVVALSLKKLPLPVALTVQNEIQPILSKYRLRAFNQTSGSTVTVSPVKYE